MYNLQIKMVDENNVESVSNQKFDNLDDATKVVQSDIFRARYFDEYISDTMNLEINIKDNILNVYSGSRVYNNYTNSDFIIYDENDKIADVNWNKILSDDEFVMYATDRQYNDAIETVMSTASDIQVNLNDYNFSIGGYDS